MDTIFALASARGKSGVAVVRISGPDAGRALHELAGRSIEPRLATLVTLRHDGVVLDEAVAVLFAGPGSFTGEDVVELGLHGSMATVAAVLEALSGLRGLRQADAGEFTRRALENEKLDLSQVEGLADLIEAETEAQRRQALRVLSGALGAKAADWRRRLVRAAALLEATLDFADEEVPTDVTPEVRELLSSVSNELLREAEGVAVAERIREGFEVAIVGPPNVGKSTLLNALAGREAAITSEIAGTTRDVIEVRMDLQGLSVTILDTAGLRSSDDAIESLGIKRATERAAQSDLCVILKPTRTEKPVLKPRDGDIVLVSKADLGDGDLSAVSGEGMDSLVAMIGNELEKKAGGAGIAIRERHRLAITNAISALETAQDQIESAPELVEVTAEELRVAIRALDSLIGQVDVEAILDDIFSSFCIGK